MSRLARALSMTRKPVMQRFAGVLLRRWINIWSFMPDFLGVLVERYLASLIRENASPHTIRNYTSDLESWVAFLTPPDGDPPAIDNIDVLTIREWLSNLYDEQLQNQSIR